MSSSREQAEAAVKSCYSSWARTYHRDYYAASAAYPPVHQQIVRAMLAGCGARTVLDAGCGPASMLRSLTDLGAELYGFDLTPSMVDEARRVMERLGVPRDHFWEGSVADPEAFRRAQGPDTYDAAICVGVLPHVPPDVESAAIANLHAAVRPGGAVAIEARNQLFALFSLNRYSHALFERELIRADQLRDAWPDAREQVDGALDELQQRFRMDLPPVRTGAGGEPGYDEVLSATHNPFVLRQRIEAAGFVDARVRFYHYHALPPMFEAAMPDLFREWSVAMEDPDDWRGHFMASAFIVTARRP